MSQVSSIGNADMTNVLNAASAVMAPFPTSNLKVTVSSVKIDATGKATVDWSDTLNGTARAKGSTVTLPAALNVANTSLDLERGAVHLQADDRLCHHRHADAQGPDLHAAAAVRHGGAGHVERDHGIGSAVVDLIFSIAKRDVTFFSGTVAISFL